MNRDKLSLRALAPLTLEPLERRTLLSTVAYNTAETHQTIESLGGNYSRAPFQNYPANDAIGQYTLEHLKPGIVRVPIHLKDWEATNDNSDANTRNWAGFNDAGESRDIFLMMQEYERRGIQIIASVYDAPDWMVSNPGNANQRIVPAENYDELTESIGAFLERAKESYGVSVDYVSFNESNGGYRLLFSPTEHASFIKQSTPQFIADGNSPKWLVGDTYQVRGTASYAKAILDDPEARPYLGPIAFHTWWSETIPASDWQTIADLAEQYNKPVWATEIGYDATAWTSTPWIFPTWQNARRIATTYHKTIKFAGASAALYWQYQDDFPLMSADTSDKYPAYHVVQQLVENFSRGTQIIGASSDTSSILALAGKHVTADRFSSQLINTADADQVVTLTGLPNNPMTLVRSSLGGEEGKTIGTYTPTNGTLTLTVKAQSVSMLSGKLAAPAPSPSPGLPAGWSGKDIGYTGLKGSSTVSNGVYTVKGAGIQIAGKADQFHFASGALSGDGEVVARVASLQNTHANARAGIMIRDTTSASSKEVSLVVTPSNAVLMQWRDSFGGATTITQVATATTPRWLKIGRSGGTFTFHVSGDGASWTQVGSKSVGMASTTLAGLAVTSGNYRVLNTATFDNVRAGSGTSTEQPPPPPPEEPPPPPPPTNEEPSTTLPAGWAGTNVGYNKVSGSTLYGNNTFHVKGGGIDIGGSADQFHFANRTLSGNGQVVARLTDMGNTSSTAKAGVMIRESTRADSRMAALMITPTGSLISIVRSSTGSSATMTTLATTTLPQWLKIVRAGSTFTFHASSNGTSWTQVGSTSVSMASTVQAGMGVTSRVSTVLNTSTFDEVAVIGA